MNERRVGAVSGRNVVVEGACPTAEQLAAFLEGRLDQDERDQVAQHVARCDACYTVVRESVAATSSAGAGLGIPDPRAAVARPFTAAGSWPGSWRWAAPIAATLLLGAGAAILLRNGDWFLNSGERAKRPLVSAVGSRRFFEARLTGGFSYGPLQRTTRSPTAPSKDWAVLAAAASIRHSAEQQATPDNRRALASAHLLLGEPVEAIRLLEAIRVDSPRDADTCSDLSAAYLIRAETEGRAEDIPRALQMASLALEQRPDMDEALFNRALALEASGLNTQARDAWLQLVTRAARTPWGEVARAHAERIRPAPLRDRSQLIDGIDVATRARDEARLREQCAREPEAARAYFDERLLARLGRDFQGTLADIQFLGRAMVSDSSDDLVAQIGAQLARSGNDSTIVHELAQYGEARTAVNRYEWDQVARRMAVVEPLLERRRSPLLGWTRFSMAAAAIQKGDTKGALALLDRTIKEYAGASQPSLMGRLRYSRSVIASSGGRWDSALSYRKAAAEDFRTSGDLGWAAFLEQQRVEVFSRMGRTALGWSERLQAVRAAHLCLENSRTLLVYAVVGDDALRMGFDRTSRAFYDEARLLGYRLGGAWAADIDLGIARSIARTDPAAARLAVSRARASVEAVADQVLKRRMQGEAMRVEAELDEADESAGAGSVDEAIAWLRERESSALLVRLLRAHATIDTRRGEAAEARAHLDRAIAIIESSGSRDADLLLSRNREAVSAYDALLDLQSRARAEPDELLRTAERRWSAANGVRAEARILDSLNALPGKLNPEACVLAYVPTRNRLVSWSVCSSGFRARTREIGRDLLRGYVDEFVRDLHRTDRLESNARLYELLVSPHASALVGKRYLFVVPAGPLASMPISQLRGPAGTRLADSFEVAMVPSLAYLRASRATQPIGTQGLLIAGFDGRGSGLPLLTNVAGELDELATTSKSMLFRQATAEQVRSWLPKATAFHFAGHALHDQEGPFRSGLLLSDGRGGMEALTVREVRDMKLGGMALAVLAACGTSSVEPDAGGSISIAGAFLHAGTQSVIGTLWDVEDRAMPAIMRALRERLMSSPSPAQAVAGLPEALRSNPASTRDALSLVVLSGAGALSRGW